MLILAAATCCSGQYAELLLKGSEFEAVLGFDSILIVLGFLRVIRDGVEWWQQKKRKIFCGTIPKYAGRVAQFLRNCYRFGRSGVRVPGRSNRTQCHQRFVKAATFLRLPRR